MTPFDGPCGPCHSGAMPAPGLGPPLAEGRTSVIHAHGRDSVVKVPRSGVPPHWPRVEAAIAEAVHRAGLPCPEVRGLVELDGRESIVFERIDAPSLWQQILERPDQVDRFAAMLVDIQHSINRVGPLDAIPRLGDRIRSKILAADGLTDDERQAALALAGALPPPTALCHGDLHPGNVLLAGGQPVVIDWFDATIGVPGADLVRTSLLIRPATGSGTAPTHLPGATACLLDEFHRSYLRHALRRVEPSAVADLATWERVLAAARLAEHTTADRADLLALWRGRPGASALSPDRLDSAPDDDGPESVVDTGGGHQDEVIGGVVPGARAR